MRAYERIVQRVTTLHRDRLGLQLMALAAALLFLVCTLAAGNPAWLFIVLWAGLLALLVLEPEGPTAALFLFGCLCLWFLALPSPTTWWSIPAACCLLLVHTGIALSTSGPASTPVPAPIRTVWRRRTLLAAAATVLAGLLTLGLVPTDRPAGSLLLSLLALGLLTAALVVLPRHLATPDRDRPGPGPTPR